MPAGNGRTALQIGISVIPATETLERIRELVRAADEGEVELLAGEVMPLLSNHLPDRGEPSQ
jgi:hypothetical protein